MAIRPMVKISGLLLCASFLWSIAPVQARTTDTCDQVYYQNNRDQFFGFNTNKRTYFFGCKDGSVSFEQPRSGGLFGWEGKCGETAISNVLMMTCGRSASPDGTIDVRADDYSPGNRPETVTNALNSMADEKGCKGKRWTYYNTADSRADFIESIDDGLNAPSSFFRKRDRYTKIRRAPVPTLIYKPSDRILHWVTVVDIIGFKKGVEISLQRDCKVIYNDWDDQHTTSCGVFAGMAEAVGTAYYVGGWFLGKFVRIKQVE